jgi:hypothetical protein
MLLSKPNNSEEEEKHNSITNDIQVQDKISNAIK